MPIQAEEQALKPRRFRDPVYDLYTFDPEKDPVDKVALGLIETPAFQRLRRIKQLGFADHVYPGASHTRFAHSLGVFAAARRIVGVITAPKDTPKELLDKEEIEDALIAALLHDVGHGPFSHAFEKVHEALGRERSHEAWTRKIILQGAKGSEPETIGSILGLDRANRIADLLEGKRRSSCWSAIISSAFDADRLDYVRRDRLMSGTGTGAIDFTWLLEHVSISLLPSEPRERTFAVNRRALQQAETFLLARYQLYDQVYFHKICRGFECLLVACLKQVAAIVAAGKGDALGLPETNLLVQHLRHGTEQTFLRIDDAVLNAALRQVAEASAPTSGSIKEKVESVKDLAIRIVNRERTECLDLERWAGNHNKRYGDVVKCAQSFAERSLMLRWGKTVFFDEPTLSVYGKAKREEVETHKKLWIDIEEEHPVEITAVSGVIRGQPSGRKIGRMFFLDKAHRDLTKLHLLDQLANLRDGPRRA